VALCLPYDRPVRAHHRRIRPSTAGHGGCPPVLRAGHRHDEGHAERSQPTGQRHIQRCSMTCRRRPGSGPTSTPTTALNATTAGRRHGYGRCAGSNRTAVPRSCWPGMPWSRTFGAATTSSRSRSQQAFELPPRSTSRPWRSDPSAGHGFGMPPVDQMQQSRPSCCGPSASAPTPDRPRTWSGDGLGVCHLLKPCCERRNQR